MEKDCEHEDTYADGLILYCNKCNKKLQDLDEPLFV